MRGASRVCGGVRIAVVPLGWRRGDALHGYMVLPRRVVYGLGMDSMSDLVCRGADASAEVTCRCLSCRGPVL